MLSLYNSLTRSLDQFKEIKHWEVTIYTCWPTVYNYAHIGNFFAYIVADTLQRYLKFLWYKVKWVMNITDVDDKTIRDSKIKYPNLPPKDALKALTSHYESIFLSDLEMLWFNLTDFHALTRATDYIESQQNLIRNIYQNWFAYISNWSVYFDIQAYTKKYKYWILADIDFDEQIQTERIISDEYEKQFMSDFALWKAEQAGEPSWFFELDDHKLPWRPWWHLECSAMEYDTLWLPFDIHTWWKDLKFPHHEDEIAQSQAWYWIMKNNYFVHNWHLLVNWAKMAKSAWNFYVLKDLLNKWYHADAIRLTFVISQYMNDFNFTENWIHSSQANLDYIREFMSEAPDNKGDSSIVEEYKDKFISAMNDSLNTPLAISYVLTMIKELRKSNNPDFILAKAFLKEVSWVFGISFSSTFVIPNEIVILAKQRLIAKNNKEFDKADQIRKEIESLWYFIKDTKEWYKLIIKP